MKAILRSINNFSCKLKQINNLKYNISPKIRSNKYKSISGNGNVVIEDAIKRNLKDYKIYGNTHQNSTTGKNLLNYIDTLVPSGGGLTNVINEDGSITTTGVPTANYKPIINQYDIIDELEDGQTYTISSETQNQYIYVQVNARKIGGGTDYIYNGNSRAVQFTVDKSKYNKYDLKIQVGTMSAWGTNSRTITNKYQLEKGGTATEFEPYTGGQPSPSPEFNQKIVSCGDRTKNLCGELEQGGYDVNTGEKYTSTTLYRNKEPIKVLPNTNCIFSINGVGQAVNVLEYKADGTYIGRIGSGTVSSNSYFTTSSETGYINIFRGTSAGIEKWQIEQNDTISSYEPYYEGYKIPVNVRGKNLLDDKNITAKTRCTVDNGVITTIPLARADTFYVNINDIPLKAGDELYTTFKVRLKSGNASRLGYGGRLYNGTTYATNTGVTPSTVSDEFAIYSIKQTVTHDIVANQMVFQAENAAGVSDAVYEIKDIIVSTNPIDTYEAYYNETTNIYLDEPLRKIGEYSDYIDFKNGKIVRNVGSKLIDGNLYWITSQFASGKRIYTLATTNIDSNIKSVNENSNKALIIADKYKTESIEDILTVTKQYAIGLSKTNYLSIQNQDYTRSADLIQSLTDDPVELNYVLLTPTEEDIELPNINLIEGKNIITVGTDIKGAIEIEYYSQEIIDISNYKYNLRKVED